MNNRFGYAAGSNGHAICRQVLWLSTEQHCPNTGYKLQDMTIALDGVASFISAFDSLALLGIYKLVQQGSNQLYGDAYGDLPTPSLSLP